MFVVAGGQWEWPLPVTRQSAHGSNCRTRMKYDADDIMQNQPELAVIVCSQNKLYDCCHARSSHIGLHCVRLPQWDKSSVSFVYDGRLQVGYGTNRKATIWCDGLIFNARDSICYSALYVIARPSVRPSVCHTGGSVKDPS